MPVKYVALTYAQVPPAKASEMHQNGNKSSDQQSDSCPLGQSFVPIPMHIWLLVLIQSASSGEFLHVHFQTGEPDRHTLAELQSCYNNPSGNLLRLHRCHLPCTTPEIRAADTILSYYHMAHPVHTNRPLPLLRKTANWYCMLKSFENFETRLLGASLSYPEVSLPMTSVLSQAHAPKMRHPRVADHHHQTT